MSEMLEKILSNENVGKGYKRVCANKGAGGVDGVTTEELQEYMRANWKSIKEQIRARAYKPQPVLRVEIPKPNGGVRKLGIPTVVDRVIEQAIIQVITPIFDPMFSENSYGFRPNRRCEQAIVKLLEYFNDGYLWIVDIDLEKFFDNVPQDKLMSFVGRVIHDGDTESLIRKYLKAGVMNRGKYEPTEIGTPQGGNLSPLLSNIMLNELDRELESRGLRFTRYADDVVIVLKSKAAATRVMYSITEWIERKLGLKVNATKTKVTPPSKLKYLGFGFWKDKNVWKARPHESSVERLKRKLKALSKRSWNIDLTYRIKKINEVARGWINYFRIGSMKTKLQSIDEHLRTRIRVIIWKQWKVAKKRVWGLLKLGVPRWLAYKVGNWGDHYQFVATKSVLARAISKEKLTKRGLVSLSDYYQKVAHI
ncbi:MAG: group II intron reverse transcriptase/maturase [Clostridiales bacterium]|nr:group II intron reverse transcriptase/maturase [Clostridiales bacterium]